MSFARPEKIIWTLCLGVPQVQGLGGWIKDLAQCILGGWKNAVGSPKFEGLEISSTLMQVV